MKIDLKLFIFLILGFIIATVIGTLSHEFGHYVVAKSKGFEAQMHYGYTSWSNGNIFDNPNHVTDILWIALGGPISTLLTSMVGLGLLFRNYPIIKRSQSLSVVNWIYIFLAMFALRFPANFLIWIIGIKRDVGTLMDEVKISMYMGWPSCILVSLSAIVGIIVLAVLVFKFIPGRQRATFILSGIVGGPIGYAVWLIIWGPILMP